jgi:hypothetical protein
MEVKAGGVVLPQGSQQNQQSQGVLPARNPHRYPVPGLEHSIVIGAPANQTNQILHKNQPFFKKIEREISGAYRRKQAHFRDLPRENQISSISLLTLFLPCDIKNERVWDIVRPLAGFVKKYFSQGPRPF